MEKLEKYGVERFAVSATPEADNKIEHQHANHLAQTIPAAPEKYTLTEILALQVKILLQIEEAGGEISEEIEQALDLVDLEQKNKVDACVYMLDQFKTRAAYLKSKEEEFRASRKVCEDIQEKMNQRIKSSMAAIGASVVMGNEYRFNLSTRKDPKITIDENHLSVDYCKIIQKYVPDRERIEQDLELGLEIPGAKFEPITVLTHAINTPKKLSKKAAK